MSAADIAKVEIELLIEGVRRRYGYDFRHYSYGSLARRLEHARQDLRLRRHTELLDRVLHDERAFDRLLTHLSVTVTEMFRDPPFFRLVREKIAPVLKTFPFVKIWHAGCATGEEVYSMAVVLHEEGLLDRARLYATDFNNASLETAEKGVYAAADMAGASASYREAGGAGDFADYYSAGYDFAKMKDFLRERITFSHHNLVTDGVFGEMNLICCRNVLIYFDRTLQDRVYGLLSDSLRHGGFLGLGTTETPQFSGAADRFEAVDAGQRIYRKSAPVVRAAIATHAAERRERRAS